MLLSLLSLLGGMLVYLLLRPTPLRDPLLAVAFVIVGGVVVGKGLLWLARRCCHNPHGS